ncbi:TetR/AcrR family transcriptional regulator [Yaniella halotolerans]|uniref:TetR/AcrR family transcriptional regulator n=1 Tax=Yaniella halotolerans TaxID=225453 RepID=UPI0003B545BF|nr:TetR/AcrR family transcriptional regulator [Yaniella halotolerans]
MDAVEPAPEKAPRGRPRSATSHQAVLNAVARLLDEQHQDYETLTIEGIAAEAGVGKQTIYRWWSTKAAVLLEAILTGHVKMHIGEVDDTGDLREDLSRWVQVLRTNLFDAQSVSLARALVSAAIIEEVNLEDYLTQNELELTAMPYKRLIAEARRGGLRSDADVSAALGALVYPIILRLISGVTPEPEWFDALVDVVVNGVGR